MATQRNDPPRSDDPDIRRISKDLRFWADQSIVFLLSEEFIAAGKSPHLHTAEFHEACKRETDELWQEAIRASGPKREIARVGQLFYQKILIAIADRLPIASRVPFTVGNPHGNPQPAWSTTPPKDPGLYWMRTIDDDPEPDDEDPRCIARVFHLDGVGLVYQPMDALSNFRLREDPTVEWWSERQEPPR